MTHFRIAHEFDADPDRYWAMFFDEGYNIEVARRLDMKERTVISRNEDEATIRFEQKLVPRRDLPHIIKKLVGGDLGYVDSEGFLFLTDRKAFTIISGGVNIYPQEIEDVLTLHPKVFDIAVIGVPDPEMGEQVKAVVQPAPGVEAGPALEQELLSYVRERIAHYKAPKSVDFVTSLPRTATGKLQKRKIRDHYLHGATNA